MFWINTENGITSLEEATEEAPAPEGVEVFETADEAVKAMDAAIEAEESALLEAQAEFEAEAEKAAAESDAAAGIVPPAASPSLLIRACVLTLLHRGDMVEQLRELGADAEADAIKSFADAQESSEREIEVRR